MRDIEGTLWSLQYISDNWKSNQKGGRRVGCFTQIGAFATLDGYDELRIIVCEGWATGVTLHMETGYGVACAGDAGNLERVAKAICEKHSDALIIVAADDDWLSRYKNGAKQNTGRIRAEWAAKAVDGLVVSPWFDPERGRSAKMTDFNDEFRLYGPGEVWTTIKNAIEEYKEVDARKKAEAKQRDETESYGDLSAPAYSEEFLALLFADRHVDDLRYIAKFGAWKFWRKNHWQEDDTLKAFDLARMLCREIAATPDLTEGNKKALASAKTVAAIERLARSDRRLAATVRQWDANPWLLGTPDGTIDLKTGKLKEARREDYITKVTAFTPGGSCPRFLAFLNDIMAGDDELVAFLKRLFGYCLTGSTSEHAMFFFYGTGRNGKSVLLNIVSAVVGDYHTTAPIETFIESQNERHPTDLAGLQGSRLVTAVETEEGRRWAESKIKNLTGGEEISARFMRQDFFQYVPAFKLVIAGNNKPSLRTVDAAIKSRLNMVPFTVFIPPEKRIKDLDKQIITEEGSGILQWMIEGCMEWQRIGLRPPKAVQDATREYLDAEDSIATWIEECCEPDPTAWKSATHLFSSWTAWADKSGEIVGSMKRFVSRLEQRPGITRHRTAAGAGFYGLKFKVTYGGPEQQDTPYDGPPWSQ